MQKQRIIEKLARENGASADTIRHWRSRGHVPYRKRLPLMRLAASRGVLLDEADFENLQPKWERRA